MSISPDLEVRRQGRRRGAFLALATLAPLLSACAVGPDFVKPAAPEVTQYTQNKEPAATIPAEGMVQNFVPDQDVPKDWWTLFRSPKLDAIIAEASNANPGTKAAEARLAEAEDSLRAGYGVFFPQVTGNASASRQLFSGAKFGSANAGSLFNLFTLSASVSYALDLWGGERRQVEALGANADLERANRDAAYLTLSTNVANTTIAIAAYRAEIAATQQMADMEKEQADIAEVQARAGTSAYADALSLRSEAAATEATIPPLQQKLTQSEDLLSVLCGKLPQNFDVAALDFSDLSLPQQVPTSVPSALVRQRPDILAAEASLHAATANVGVATAALLPNITLSGTYGTNGLSTAQLFGANSAFWSVGAALAQPLFDGGTLWFQRKAALDSLEESKQLYAQTVLAAFEQVADSLRALEHDALALKSEEEAAQAAGGALKLVQADYKAGIATYAQLLIADVQYHQANIAVLEARALRYQDTVALLAALGGGWGDSTAASSTQNARS